MKRKGEGVGFVESNAFFLGTANVVFFFFFFFLLLLLLSFFFFFSAWLGRLKILKT